jgi:hypothetical protein
MVRYSFSTTICRFVPAHRQGVELTGRVVPVVRYSHRDRDRLREFFKTLFLVLAFASIFFPAVHAIEPPAIRTENGLRRLIVSGKPFLIPGGELGNSSAGTAAQADSILPKVAGMHITTAVIPVAPVEVAEPRVALVETVCRHSQRAGCSVIHVAGFHNGFSRR